MPRIRNLPRCGTLPPAHYGSGSDVSRHPPTSRVCVCYGPTGRGTRTGHTSGTSRNRHGGATRSSTHTNQASGPSTPGS
eukprot:5589433-Prymnesium_polylepis.1